VKEETKQEIYNFHARICKAIAATKRLLIINELREDRKTVGELAAALGFPQAMVSQHLAILRERGIVLAERSGVNIYYSIANPKIIQAFDLLREVMAEQLSKEKELPSVSGRRGNPVRF